MRLDNVISIWCEGRKPRARFFNMGPTRTAADIADARRRQRAAIYACALEAGSWQEVADACHTNPWHARNVALEIEQQLRGDAFDWPTRIQWLPIRPGAKVLRTNERMRG